MSPINKQDVFNALKSLTDKVSGKDIVTAGIISSVSVADGNVSFIIEANQRPAQEIDALKQSCENAIRAISGVKNVKAIVTAENQIEPPPPVEGVKHIIAVASGKGGVGKSTIALGIAQALTRAGHRVGMVDADIYGPSLPHLLGVSQTPDSNAQKQLIPVDAQGIQSMSMGYIVDANKAAVWRGPMATKALYQLFKGVAWDNVEYLIVDMPPGTGDIQLSLAKHFPVSGAVLVSTPQEIAVMDVRKAADMFRKVHIPIIGLIENMSYFQEPSSGQKHYIFGQGGGKTFAESEIIPFLGEIPLFNDISTHRTDYLAQCDAVFLKLAEKIA